MENSKIKGIVFVFLATVVFGAQSVLTRTVLVAGLEPHVLMGIKLLGGLLTLSILAIVTGEKLAIKKKDLKYFIPLGVVGGLLFSLFLAISYSINGASQAVILLYTAPVFTMLLAHFFLGEKINKIKIMALVLVALGIVLVSVGSLEGEFKFTLIGLFFGLASGLCYGLFNVLGKKLSGDYSSLNINFFMILIAVITMLPVYPFFNWELLLGDQLVLTLVGLLYGFLIFGVGNFLLMKGMKHLEAGTVSILANTEPVFAVIMAVIFLGEKLLPLQIVGFIGVLGGALLVSRNKNEN